MKRRFERAFFRTSTPVRKGLRALLAAAFWAHAAAFAMRIEADLEPQTILSTERAVLEVRLSAIDDEIIAVRLPAADGVAVEGPGAPVERFHGGADSPPRSSLLYRFTLRPKAHRDGTITLAPLEIELQRLGVVRYPLPALEVVRAASDPLRFEATLERPRGVVGEPVTVRYRILHTHPPATSPDRRGVPQRPFGIELLELSGLETGARLEVHSISPPSGRALGRLRVGEQALEALVASELVRNERGGYRALVFSFELTPRTAGRLRLGGQVVFAQTASRETPGARPDPLGDGFVLHRLARLNPLTYEVGPAKQQVAAASASTSGSTRPFGRGSSTWLVALFLVFCALFCRQAIKRRRSSGRALEVEEKRSALRRLSERMRGAKQAEEAYEACVSYLRLAFGLEGGEPGIADVMQGARNLGLDAATLEALARAFETLLEWRFAGPEARWPHERIASLLRAWNALFEAIEARLQLHEPAR